MIMSLKQKKIQFKARIKLNNNMLASNWHPEWIIESLSIIHAQGKLSQGKNDVEAMWSPVP